MADERNAWSRGRDSFATTRWSQVTAAADPDSEPGREALAELCRSYWLPLYAYARRRSPTEHEARDLTQAFFTRLLEHRDLAAAQRERGRFRAFLLSAFRHFLSNERDREHAQKRGGGRPPLSLDFDDGDSRLVPEPGDPTTPEQDFERQWVSTLLARVFERLRSEALEKGQGEEFELLRPAIAGAAARGAHARVAAELGMSVGAVRMAAQRLRERYREILRSEIAQTVQDPAEVDDEIANLFAAVRPSPRIL